MTPRTGLLTRLRRALCSRRGTGVALAIVLALATPQNAFAFDVISSGGLYTDGVGGYGVDGGTDDSLWVGDGAGTAVSKVLPDCDDTGGNHLNYDTTGNTFSCGTSTGSVASSHPMGFTTVSVVDLNGSSAFISASGNVSSTEANVARMPVPTSGTLDNLRCSSSADPVGTSLKVQMQVTTCGTPATFSCGAGDQCVTLPSGATATAADTDDLAVTAGQCLVFKATAVGDTAAVFIGCSWTLT